MGGVEFTVFGRAIPTTLPHYTMPVYIFEALLLLNAIMLELMLIATYERYQEHKNAQP